MIGAAKARIRPYIDIHDVPIHLPLPHWKMPTSSLGEILMSVSSTGETPLEPQLTSHGVATHRVAERYQEEQSLAGLTQTTLGQHA